ncbi:stage II sporulation protein R [Bacillus alveayuensis]|jgi:stage II sporulation protein R|uniref:Stage II sporulation protein R n=1 Tax=Aeribacillus alveayuensis TaxID=279215 RepID=A0ABT9VNS0_9BACI|nr:stage II sporulation protein R [Bacillus alveayuensis]MDQ0162624.1 stage II sporulation protein R [Bacillus alveayuensis]
MKKQALVLIYILLLLIGGLLTAFDSPTEARGNTGVVVIPNEAIRLRILANSDSEKDQQLKRKIRDAINGEVSTWVQDVTSIDKARQIIRKRLPEIETIVQTVLEEENRQQSFTVDFNKVQFPTKLYGNYLYPAGNYEAILVTLGEGKGANWWCVLFPPLCFLDFSNSEAVRAEEANRDDQELNTEKELKVVEKLVTREEENSSQVEVKFFLVEWFTNLFSKS